MSQDVFNDIDPNVTSGTQLAAYLNDFKAALLTQHSGSSAPSYAEIGTEWLDTSVAGSLVFKKYDGTQWVTTFTIDDSAHTLSLGGNNPVASITVTRTDTSADMIEMYRDTQTQTNSGLIFSQKTDANNKKTFAKFKLNAESVAEGAEEASASIEAFDAGTLKEIFKVAKDSFFAETFKGTGKRNLVTDANGNVTTEAAVSGGNVFSNGDAVTGDDTTYINTGLSSFGKSTTSTELIDQSQVFKAVSTAAAQTLETEDITIPVGYIDQPLILSIPYKAGADWTVEILDQADSILVSETLKGFTPVLNEANVKKMFAVLPSGTTTVSVRFTSTAADTLIFDKVQVYSWVTTEEPLYFSRDILNNQTNTDLFLIASLKYSAYKVKAKITRQTDTNFAQGISEFFINYSSDAGAWSIKKETISDFESVEVETTFDMNVRTLNYDSSDITGANYAGEITGTITRIL